MKVNKLALGTVQFGLDYGINNKRGRIPEKEVFDILAYAHESGIDTLDTARGYGASEEVIGRAVKSSGKNFRIISKFSGRSSSLVDELNLSLKNTGSSSLYGYLFHSFKDFSGNPGLLKELEECKSKNKISKSGFSLYYPGELESIWEQGINPDIIQFPYNIFDRRFEKHFERLKNNGTEMHIRSVFLQGLFFKDPDTLEGKLFPAREKLRALHEYSKKNNISIAHLCLNFALGNEFIDKVVTGIDSISNLRDIISIANKQHKIYSELGQFTENNETILLPFNWV